MIAACIFTGACFFIWLSGGVLICCFVNFLCATCRDDEFDLDLEEIMVMEAIWLSIQVNFHGIGLIIRHPVCDKRSSLVWVVGGRILTYMCAALPSFFFFGQALP